MQRLVKFKNMIDLEERFYENKIYAFRGDSIHLF